MPGRAVAACVVGPRRPCNRSKFAGPGVHDTHDSVLAVTARTNCSARPCCAPNNDRSRTCPCSIGHAGHIAARLCVPALPGFRPEPWILPSRREGGVAAKAIPARQRGPVSGGGCAPGGQGFRSGAERLARLNFASRGRFLASASHVKACGCRMDGVQQEGWSKRSGRHAGFCVDRAF